MKKIALVAFVGCALTAGTAFAADTAATLTVNGTLSELPDCSIAFDHSVADLGQKNIQDLPYIGVSDSDMKNQNAYVVTFTGTSCLRDRFGVKFLGTADASGKALSNTLSGPDAATGIGVNVYDFNGGIITPNNNIQILFENLSGRLPFHLSMAKNNQGQVEAGNVQANLTVELTKI